MPTHSPIPGTHSIDEYLRFEAEATERHEYRDGLIVPVQGGPLDHSTVIVNLICEIGNRLKGTGDQLCEGSLRIRVDGMPFFAYPDLKVIRGTPQFDRSDPRQESVLNPHLIVEVLCPRSEAFDRAEKFRIYRMINSLREYVVASTSSAMIESFVREPDGSWCYTPFVGPDAKARLRSVNVELSLSEVYDGVTFDPRRSWAR